MQNFRLDISRREINFLYNELHKNTHYRKEYALNIDLKKQRIQSEFGLESLSSRLKVFRESCFDVSVIRELEQDERLAIACLIELKNKAKVIIPFIGNFDNFYDVVVLIMDESSNPRNIITGLLQFTLSWRQIKAPTESIRFIKPEFNDQLVWAWDYLYKRGKVTPELKLILRYANHYNRVMGILDFEYIYNRPLWSELIRRMQKAWYEYSRKHGLKTGKKQTSVVLSKHVLEQLKIESKKTGITQSEIVERLLRKKLNIANIN